MNLSTNIKRFNPEQHVRIRHFEEIHFESILLRSRGWLPAKLRNRTQLQTHHNSAVTLWSAFHYSSFIFSDQKGRYPVSAHVTVLPSRWSKTHGGDSEKEIGK